MQNNLIHEYRYNAGRPKTKCNASVILHYYMEWYLCRLYLRSLTSADPECLLCTEEEVEEELEEEEEFVDELTEEVEGSCAYADTFLHVKICENAWTAELAESEPAMEAAAFVIEQRLTAYPCVCVCVDNNQSTLIIHSPYSVWIIILSQVLQMYSLPTIRIDSSMFKSNRNVRLCRNKKKKK